MPVTTTSQFGRRGGAPPRDLPRDSVAQASSAAAALAAATGSVRPSREPSLKSIYAPLPPQDLWTPKSDTAAPASAVVARPGLLALLFSAQGRIRRRDYWVIGMLSSVIVVLAAVVMFLDLSHLQAAVGILVLLLAYARIRSCLRIKRWHDRGKSAVWLLVGYIPFVGWLWAFVECALLEGTPGDNAYGPSPK